MISTVQRDASQEEHWEVLEAPVMGHTRMPASKRIICVNSSACSSVTWLLKPACSFFIKETLQRQRSHQLMQIPVGTKKGTF